MSDFRASKVGSRCSTTEIRLPIRRRSTLDARHCLPCLQPPVGSSAAPAGGGSHLRDQLQRAADSVVLNIAEGRAHFRIAAGSAAERCAALDLIRPRSPRPGGAPWRGACPESGLHRRRIRRRCFRARAHHRRWPPCEQLGRNLAAPPLDGHAW
ncbi:MAG: four helix bundle protein [Myxococcales bacterium]|nr:four helix bundle protein [Myxococcales bacterium]